MDSLGATTSYRESTAKKTERPPKWRTFYGSGFKMVPSGVLDADGKPTGYRVVQEWTAQPGEVITSRGGQKYMVHPDHSLRTIDTNDQQRTKDMDGHDEGSVQASAPESQV